MDILDLDALAPPDKYIKVRGKTLVCKPLTIRQLITVIKLEDRLKQVEQPDEIIKIIKEALTPFMPDLAKDDTIDFTVLELRQIVQFAQKVSVPDPASEVAKIYEPKKKVASAEESPTSLTSTPATPPKQS